MIIPKDNDDRELSKEAILLIKKLGVNVRKERKDNKKLK